MQIETPQQFDEVRRECIARVKFYVDLAHKKIGVQIPYPRVEFSLKGTTAGTANYAKNLIRFSPTLLRENVEEFLHSTTGHEVAHLIAMHQEPACEPHGMIWGAVMHAFSLPATRCHRYDVKNVPSKVGKRSLGRPTVIVTAGAVVRPMGYGKVIEFD
jgi:SprT protein